MKKVLIYIPGIFIMFGCELTDLQSVSNSNSEPPDETSVEMIWQRSIAFNGTFIGEEIVPAGNGYFISGYVTKNYEDATYVGKITENGTWEWINEIGFSTSNYPLAIHSLPTLGCLIVVKIYGDPYSHYLVKLNSEGTMAWKKGLEFDFEADSFLWNSDGSLMATGRNAGIWMSKFNEFGDLIKSELVEYDSSNSNKTKIMHSDDGGFLIFLSSLWENKMLKVNSSWKVDSLKTIKYWHRIFPDYDNGFLTYSGNNIYKLDSDYNEIWAKHPPRKGVHDFRKFIRLSNGNILGVGGGSGNIFGYTFSEVCRTNCSFWCCTTLADALIVEFDPNGNYIQQRCFGGEGEAMARSVTQTFDGNCLFVGTNNFGDLWAMKFSL